MPVKFLIVSSGYNCAPLVKKCIDSLKNQTYQNFDAVFISDGSTDNTGEQISVHITDTRFLGEIFVANMGAAKRRYDAIKEYAEDEEVVVLLLGLDDELFPHALERIAKEYEKGVWMTYGNWKNQRGWCFPVKSLYFDSWVHKERSYRKVKYRSTAPNTFKRFLFDQIPSTDFMLDGKWIDSTTESELMFSCLEMCGKDRIGVIEDYIYLYNEGLQGGTLKRLGVKYKYDIYAEVIKRPAKPLLIRP